MGKHNIIKALLLILTSLPAFLHAAADDAQADPTIEAEAKSLQEQMGYFYGYSFGNMLKDGGSADVDISSLVKGLQDSLQENPPALDAQQRDAVYQEVRARQLQAQAAKKAEQEAEQLAAQAAGETNLAEANQFLAENAKREGIVTTPTGLQYEVLVDAQGEKPTALSRVVVNYVGSFTNGDVFDQSGEIPAEFGLQQVISGWTEGLQLMDVGDKYRFYLHPDLAYGAGSVGRIPPNSLLVFDIELLDIK